MLAWQSQWNKIYHVMSKLSLSRDAQLLKLTTQRNLTNGVIKCWILSGVSGFSYKFELCAGNQGYVEVPNEPDFEAASNVVVRMARKIPNNMHHKLYYDNYFSSLPLVALSVRYSFCW
jgi:hypothetical protein